MDHQIPEASVNGGSGNPSQRPAQRNLSAGRGEYLKRARGEGPRASVGLDPAAGDNQSVSPAVKRKKCIQIAWRVRTGEAAILGRTPVGARYFCCSSGQVTDEVIKQYIANHGQENDDDFRVEGEESPST